MNHSVDERFVGLVTYGDQPDPRDAHLIAASLWSTESWRTLPSTSWPSIPDSAQLHAMPWLANRPDAAFLAAPSDVAQRVADLLALVVEQRGVVCVWNAPQVFGILAGHLPDWTPPPLILDLRVLDRQLNSERKGRRTLTTTAEFYDVPVPAGVLEPHQEAELLVHVAQTMLREHRLGMPFSDLAGQQKVWHAEQSTELAKWLLKNRRPIDYVDSGWPLRNDQRLWHAEALLEAWTDPDAPTDVSDDQVKAAVRTLLALGNRR